MEIAQYAKIALLWRNYEADQEKIGKIKKRLADVVANSGQCEDMALFADTKQYKEFRDSLIKKLKESLKELENKWALFQPEDVLEYLNNDDTFVERSLRHV